ncbi:hypothetical protein GQ600_2615 [Phytophthora cactorum]|nr:hypothetical protein GQ600_2615 [Phytophthora cactorum]
MNHDVKLLKRWRRYGALTKSYRRRYAVMSCVRLLCLGIEKAYYMMKYTTKAQMKWRTRSQFTCTPSIRRSLSVEMRVMQFGRASSGAVDVLHPVEAAGSIWADDSIVLAARITVLFFLLVRKAVPRLDCDSREAVDVMLHAAGSGATFQPSSPLLD